MLRDRLTKKGRMGEKGGEGFQEDSVRGTPMRRCCTGVEGASVMDSPTKAPRSKAEGSGEQRESDWWFCGEQSPRKERAGRRQVLGLR